MVNEINWEQRSSPSLGLWSCKYWSAVRYQLLKVWVQEKKELYQKPPGTALLPTQKSSLTCHVVTWSPLIGCYFPNEWTWNTWKTLDSWVSVSLSLIKADQVKQIQLWNQKKSDGSRSQLHLSSGKSKTQTHLHVSPVFNTVEMTRYS